MINFLMRADKLAYIISIILAMALLMAFPFLLKSQFSSKILNTSGILFTISGLIQMRVSGFFERLFSEYNDEKKHPYGPPSYVVRNIMDQPDRPYFEYFRSIAFFNNGTAYWLILIGSLIQILGQWL